MARHPIVAVGVAATLLALGPATPERVMAQCDRPQMLLTVDKSSSMVNSELAPGLTKWDAAVTAIRTMTTSFSDEIDFGLQIYPMPNRCQPGEVVVNIGRNSSNTIVSALGSPPPTGGNYTPTFETLDVAARYAPLNNTNRRNFMTLITDGEQWCDPYDPAKRFNLVTSVEDLRDRGITVFVVGFGSGVDALALNRAAAAAGTATQGCDPTSSDAMAANNCYLAALDSVALNRALEGIADVATAEDCNGFDDDCDGNIDEGYDADNDEFTTCGTRPNVEQPPNPVNVDCDDTNPDIRPGAMETCDGLDNNCDGAVDPGCNCQAGQTRMCGNSVGACTQGSQECSNGRWGPCSGGVRPGAETCEGTDEDCDGNVDEESLCAMGFLCIAGTCRDFNEPPPADMDSDGDGILDDVECPGGLLIDTDMDSIPDCLDEDDDNDGILTRDERPDGADQDTDRDGKPNHLDPDDDGDGVPTRTERPGLMDAHTDADGLPDHHDPDDDGDTIPTFDERPMDTSPDTDGDTRPDYLDDDDDGDMIPTATEINDDMSAGDDLDGDGQASHRDTDSDNDGLSDAMEGRADQNMNGALDYLDPSYPGLQGNTDGFGVSGGALGPCVAGTSGSGTAALLPLLVLLLVRRRRP